MSGSRDSGATLWGAAPWRAPRPAVIVDRAGRAQRPGSAGRSGRPRGQIVTRIQIQKVQMKTTITDPFLPDTSRDHHQGPADAPIKLLEYGDFECPACAEAYPLVKALKRQLGD